MGIPPQVADYMQKAIDSKGPKDKKILMPEDFAKHCQEQKIIWAGHKNLAIADLAVNMHDRARHKVVQAEDLKFLLSKGEDYVKAYYVHFILDYLVKMDYWMTTTGDSVSDCIEKYVKNKAVVVPETSQCLMTVVEFLKTNYQELQGDYNLK
jgi:hypothetical protein